MVILTCLTSHLNAQVTIGLEENDKYHVLVFNTGNETKYTFYHTSEFGNSLNKSTDNYIKYSNIYKNIDNTIVMDGFSIDRELTLDIKE